MRSVMIVWESADWPSLHPYIDAGLMPNLQRLIERGTMATMTSASPLTREILLTSIATGLHADRHGVLGPLQVRADAGGLEAAGRRSWQAPAFWELLEANGIRTACIDWPATSPADRWPGLHVDESFATPSGAGFETWAVPPHSVSPAELADDLIGLRVHPADALGGEIAAFVPRVQDVEQGSDRHLAALGSMLARGATTHATATYIAQLQDWDVLCVHYRFLHDVKIAFLNVDAKGPYADVVRQAHRLQDMMLGRMIALAGDASTVILTSPHGIVLASDGTIGDHPRGILVASGPGIAVDAILSNARTVDLAPTLLARYGLAIHSDGSVLEELVPPGRNRRLVQAVMAEPNVDGWDPAEDLMAQGYRDPLTQAQHQAMVDAESVCFFHLGVALMSRGNLTAGARALETAMQRRPADTRVLLCLAQCRVLMGDYEACRPLGEALLATDPNKPWGHLIMGASYAMTSDSSEVEPYLVSARDLGAGIPDVLIRTGGIELLRSRPGTAAADFEAALMLTPTSFDAAYGLGLSRYLLGDLTAAEAALRRAIKLDHGQPQVHHQLGTVLIEQGRLSEALTTLEVALGQDSGQRATKELLDCTRAALAAKLANAAMAKSRS